MGKLRLGFALLIFAALPGLGRGQEIRITQFQGPLNSAIAAGDSVVIVNWTGGTPPFQVECRANVSGTWHDVDGITYASSQTNIPTGSIAFYRVVSVANTYPGRSDTKAPSVPTGLTATAVGWSQINLSWNASIDPSPSPSGIKGYNVSRNGIFLKQVLVPATSTSDSDLAASTAYTYAVSAVDNSFNQSAKSSPATATTPSCGTPDNPPTTSLTAPGSGTIVSGTTALSGTATDDVGVDRVEIWSDGSVLLGTVTTPPYSVNYDTCALSNGSHSFTSKAYDTAGQFTISGEVPATVSNTVSPPGQLQWIRSMTNLYGASVISKGIATDRSGNAIAVGQFANTAEFGGGPLSSAGLGFFIAKYTGQNGFLWAKSLAQTGESSAYSVVADSRDNIIVTGYFTGTKDFGGVTLRSTTNQVGSASPDIFVAKYSPSGGLMWVTNYGGSYSDMGYAVAVDASDNIFLAAKFQVIANFGDVTLTSSGNSIDIALVKLSSTGALLWVKRRGGNYDDYVYGLAVDSFGDVLVTGSAGGPCDLGGGTTTVGGIILAKYSGVDGAYRWGKALGGSAGRAIAIDPNTRNIVITGGTQGSVDFGGGSLPGQSGMAIFLASYDPSGAYLWARTWGGAIASSSDQGLAVCIDGNGNLTLTGQVVSPVDFGGGWLFGNGNANYFVASFTISGNSPPALRWARRSGSGTNGSGSGNGIAYDSSGHVLTTGFYMGTVDFGGDSASSPNSYAAFVAKYAE